MPALTICSNIAAVAAGASSHTAAGRRSPCACTSPCSTPYGSLRHRLGPAAALVSSRQSIAGSMSSGSVSATIRGRGGSTAAGSVVCRGYVGERTRPAGEYHSSDFPWEELAPAGQAALERQRSERDQHGQEQQHQASSGAAGAAVAAAAVGNDALQQQQQQAAVEYGGREEGASWEAFHAQHSQARFFKEKRYLMLEFPVLALEQPAQHVAEIGCGCGSALLPVLKANPTCRVTGCDVSPTALQLFRRAAEQAGVAPDRIHTFVLDASGSGSGSGSSDNSTSGGSSIGGHAHAGSSFDGSSGNVCNGSSTTSSTHGVSSRDAGSPLAGLGADSLLVIFTLSALLPEDQPALLAHAYAALRPGGLLLFRDYGLYDMAQLRFPGAQMLGDNLYRRSEGTLAYFFSTEALRQLAVDAGFEEVECQYATVEMRNRKTGGAMRRVFVHGVFRKPS